jgi:hypothetical protein
MNRFRRQQSRVFGALERVAKAELAGGWRERRARAGGQCLRLAATDEAADSPGATLRRAETTAEPVPFTPSVRTFSTSFQGRPCGRPPPAAVLGRLIHNYESATADTVTY